VKVWQCGKNRGQVNEAIESGEVGRINGVDDEGEQHTD